MTKKKKILSIDQPSLFDVVKETTSFQNGSIPKGRLDIDKEFKAALSDDIRHAHTTNGRELSRAEIAARLTDYIGEEISLTTLNNWTAISHPHQIPASYLPASYLPAWVYATNGHRAIDAISRHSGLFMLPGPDAIRAKIQRLEEGEEQIRREKETMKFYLKEIEGR